jgi:hypothetical protein
MVKFMNWRDGDIYNQNTIFTQIMLATVTAIQF